jgi:cell wall-associated NlpC family hydrolase
MILMMSFTDAVGQIDQILQWEQQLSGASSAATPSSSSVASATVAGTYSTTSPGSASATAATFADLLAQAQAQAQAPAQAQTSAAMTDTSGPAGGIATSADDPRIQAMLQQASSLVGEPYVWGGGHGGWGTQAGYDCSGFVSAVLHAGGYLSSPQDTTSLPSAAGMQSGPGQYVTVYDRDQPGQAGHVIIDIDGQFYESGGEHGSWGGGGGVQQISTPSAAYLSTFNVVLHPQGL